MKWYDKPLFTQKQGAIAFCVIIGSLITIEAIDTNKKKKLIEECPRYTIAYVTTVKRKEVNYRYSIFGQNFTEIWGQKPRSVKDYFRGDFAAENFKYGRFLIRVNCKHPEISRIDWSHSIPESVGSAPYEGWTKLPTSFRKTEFSD